MYSKCEGPVGNAHPRLIHELLAEHLQESVFWFGHVTANC
jgi:hypothetical protein